MMPIAGYKRIDCHGLVLRLTLMPRIPCAHSSRLIRLKWQCVRRQPAALTVRASQILFLDSASTKRIALRGTRR
jgi:hypothetical protein